MDYPPWPSSAISPYSKFLYHFFIVPIPIFVNTLPINFNSLDFPIDYNLPQSYTQFATWIMMLILIHVMMLLNWINSISANTINMIFNRWNLLISPTIFRWNRPLESWWKLPFALYDYDYDLTCTFTFGWGFSVDVSFNWI